MNCLSEKEALESAKNIWHTVNRCTFTKLADSLLCGVPLTEAQMSKAAEEIYYFFHNNGAGRFIEDLILKTRYRKDGAGNEVKINAWLETRDGVVLSALDMHNLVHRLRW